MKIEIPQDNVEAFLYNSFNADIYDDLTDGWEHAGLFDPLTFFNHLYSEYVFFRDNALNYATIKNHFKPYEHRFLIQGNIDFSIPRSTDPRFINVVTNDNQRIYFLNKFFHLIENYYLSFEPLDRDFYKVENEMFQRSYEYIKRLYGMTMDKIATDPYENYKFEAVKKELDNIPLTVDKIKYLIRITTAFVQEFEGSDFEDIDIERYGMTYHNDGFLRKCNLEMEALKKILELEKTHTNPQNQTAEPQLKTLDWKGTDLQFTELVKALIESGVLNTTIILQKEIFNRLRFFFNIKEFNENDKIRDIRLRTEDQTPFLDKLIVSITNFIKKKD